MHPFLFMTEQLNKEEQTVCKRIASFPNVLHCAELLIKTPVGNNGKFLGEMVNAKDQSNSLEHISYFCLFFCT